MYVPIISNKFHVRQKRLLFTGQCPKMHSWSTLTPTQTIDVIIQYWAKLEKHFILHFFVSNNKLNNFGLCQQ